MKLILAAATACLLAVPPAFAQQGESTEGAAPLTLRGGATATGLFGFWDYQSNGSSPEYLQVRRGEWNQLYTTFLNSTSEAEVGTSRRVGYAYSSDGGVTWISHRTISDVRLGFPALDVSDAGIPYIAAHGNLGPGLAAHLFAPTVATQPGSFARVASLPLMTQSGRSAGGVLWPAFTLTDDQSKAVFLGAYSFGDADPIAPLQSAVVDLSTKQPTTQTWRNVTDSLLSVVSSQNYSISRSANGTIGVAYYRFPLFTPDLSAGVYFTQSSDDGATWSTPEHVMVGAVLNSDVNLNGNPDTLFSGYNLDLAYNGEDPQIVVTGDLFTGGFDITQVANRNILYWSRSRGLKMIVRPHQVLGLGAYVIPGERAQADMNAVSYPTLAVGEDGQHIVVAFTAVSQERGAGNTLNSVVSEDGFFYHRLWAVGSSDGGATWGTPFIVQDFAGAGTDSASIEYPSAADVARVVDGNFELNVTFQARRYPGGFAFLTGSQLPGRKQEVHQYFQRFMVTPAMFQAVSSVDRESESVAAPAISRLYPNPATSSLMLEYSLPGSGAVEITLINSLGEEVVRQSREQMQHAGDHTGTLNVAGIPAGSYRCVIRQNGASISRMVNIVR